MVEKKKETLNRRSQWRETNGGRVKKAILMPRGGGEGILKPLAGGSNESMGEDSGEHGFRQELNCEKRKARLT